MSTRSKLVWLCVVGLVSLSACGDGGQAEAEAALQALKSAYEGVKADAAVYAPEQAQSVEAGLAAVEESVADGEYAQALIDVETFSISVKKLGSAVAAKKTTLTSAWNAVASSVPPALQRLQTKIDQLAKSARLPKGIDKTVLAAAKSEAASLSSTWEEAQAAANASNLSEALAKAQSVTSKAAQIFASLGEPQPDAPRSKEK